jgi:hypothetical protein
MSDQDIIKSKVGNINKYLESINENEASDDDPNIAYQKQLLRNNNYYENNKEKVLNKQKEYRSKISNEDKAKAKIIYYLNNDKDYKNKVKPQTVEKYNIKFVNGLWS